jgi:hypothetical protein
MRKPRLYIAGDSFGSIEMGRYGEDLVWTTLLAKKLDADIVNNSLIGAAQDFAWASLHAWHKEIQPTDYVVVILTHPGRVWYVQDQPTMTKPEHVIVPGHDKAAEMYFRYIQRPTLDLIHLENRLGWLAYNSYLNKWRKPLVITAFEQEMYIAKDYPDIELSIGSLTENVANKEVEGGNDSRLYNKLMKGYDPRFNHMCLSNHHILVDKIYESLTQGVKLDLTNGFIQNILTEEAINDKDFVKKELNQFATERRKNELLVKRFGLFG